MRSLLPLLFASTMACTDPAALAARAQARALASSPDAGGVALDVDIAIPPAGVPDRGRTPGLVAIAVDGRELCAGALVASNIVVVPGPCVVRDSGNGCKAIVAWRVHIASGDDDRAPLGSARDVIAGATCDDDALAAIVMTRHADGLAPFAVRSRAAIAGDFVRTVGLHEIERGPATRMLRDHFRITASARDTFDVPGDPCGILPGAVVVDESTGELVGIAVDTPCRDPADEAAGSVTTTTLAQVDAHRALIDTAFVRATQAPSSEVDGGVDKVDGGTPRKGKAVRPAPDVGEPCHGANECAAGVCVRDVAGDEAGSGYCSRTCGSGDRCLTGFHCERTPTQVSVCFRAP